MLSGSYARACGLGRGRRGWAARVPGLTDDVGQRTPGGCGWGGRDCGLHQRSRLLPPFAAAPRVPAAPAAGNARAGLGSGSHPEAGPPVGSAGSGGRDELSRDAVALGPLPAAGTGCFPGAAGWRASQTEGPSRAGQGRGGVGRSVSAAPRSGAARGAVPWAYSGAFRSMKLGFVTTLYSLLAFQYYSRLEVVSFVCVCFFKNLFPPEFQVPARPWSGPPEGGRRGLSAEPGGYPGRAPRPTGGLGPGDASAACGHGQGLGYVLGRVALTLFAPGCPLPF